jgi:hypothetical protein
MRLFVLAPNYVYWHYGSALKGIRGISTSIVWFIWHFFSINLLGQTLFSPWQRIQEKHERGVEFWDWFEVFAINLLMRIVGLIVRIIMICLGLSFIVVTLFVSIIFCALWLALPVVVVFLFIFGLILLFKPV